LKSFCKNNNFANKLIPAALAQVVVHSTNYLEIAGSNPTTGGQEEKTAEKYF
jgi:hypothetical protein